MEIESENRNLVNPRKTTKSISLYKKLFGTILGIALVFLAIYIFAFQAQTAEDSISWERVRNWRRAKGDQLDLSFADANVYEIYTLKSGLKVLLVSDPVATHSTAVFRVRVGSIYDPIEFPGLAHFTEHMLFMGTKAHPSPDLSFEILSRFDGNANAMTSNDRTSYYFTVLDEGLDETFDVYSRFFIDPLFTKETLSKEALAVDSEYQNSLGNPDWAYYRMIIARGNASHPSNGFTVGSVGTLDETPKKRGVDMSQVLRTFFNTYYNPTNISLVVVANRPIEGLKKLVNKNIEQVKDRHAEGKPPKKIDQNCDAVFPPNSSMFQMTTYYRSLDATAAVYFTFVFPGIDPLRKVDPLDYLGTLLNDNKPGSLAHNLVKVRRWATDFGAGIVNADSFITLYHIEIRLTPEGLANANSIPELVFAYLEAIRKEANLETLFKQLKEIDQVQYYYAEAPLPSEEVSGIMEMAERLLQNDSSIHDVLTADYIQEEPLSQKTFESFLDRMTPSRTMYLMRTPNFTNSEKRRFRLESVFSRQSTSRAPITIFRRDLAAISLEHNLSLYKINYHNEPINSANLTAFGDYIRQNYQKILKENSISLSINNTFTPSIKELAFNTECVNKKRILRKEDEETGGENEEETAGKTEEETAEETEEESEDCLLYTSPSPRDS
eukprot:TRINITY_DN12140_c0_g1_i1.p1 TRINITY_DN12140_c0_g1~~TRINITY_DN12140_c0_g1_i1.p1  ORF type:complete len:667 (-),score=163.33 TRINITY_DN12140_c0_g1_i1:38-2038(-)